MRVLIAGGAGFLGSHLVDYVLQQGADVYVIDNEMSGTPLNLTEAFALAKEKGQICVYAKHDIIDPLDEDALVRLFGGSVRFDQIYNMACPASPPMYQKDPIHTLRTSVWGSYNLLELAQRHGARFLLSSTSEIYGDPSEHPQQEDYRGNVNCTGIRACYDEGKRAAETLAYDYQRTRGVEVRVVRLFNTYGPRMNPDDGRIVSNFIVQALRGVPLTVYGDGSQTRSFCFVEDTIRGIAAIMNGEQSIPINIGNPDEYTILEMANIVLSRIESPSSIVYCDLPSDDPKIRCPDTSRAQQYLSWTPTVNLESGLEKTIAYFRSVIHPN